MSTKTLRKRIALVAVSALGFGLVGAAPSSAAAITCTAATGGLTVQAGVSSVIGTCDVSAAITTADNLTMEVVTGPEAGVMTMVSVGTGTFVTTHAVGAANATTGNSGAANTGTGVENVTASFDLPGVYTVKFGTATAVTVTVVAGSSTTTSLTATTGNSGAYVTGATPVITVSRNTGVAPVTYDPELPVVAVRDVVVDDPATTVTVTAAAPPNTNV